MYISEREFLERFELSPGLYRRKGARLESEKLSLLYSMIAEKLLAQEALERNFDRDSLYSSALDGVARLLARDELYRQEVGRKVSVTPAEITQGMQQARTELLVRFLFCEDSTTAAFLRGRIRTAEDLDRMVPESGMGVLRDTATVVWGDADTTIERTAYALSLRSVSPAVRAGDGWYILRVVSTRRSPVYGELSPGALRERVEATVRRRKEVVREIEFLRDFLRDKVAYSPPRTARRFAEAVRVTFRERYRPPSTTLDSAAAAALQRRCAPFLEDTLLVAGGKIWRTGEMIDHLRRRGFAVSGDSVFGIPGRLRAVFEEMAHHELLAQEAMRRGLDRTPEVQKKLEPWRHHFLAGIARRRIPLSATDGEVYAYLRSTGASPVVPEVRLRELRTPSIEQMAKAIELLDAGGSFEDAVARFSSDPAAKTTGGLTAFFPVSERQPIGSIAAAMKVGQIYGPLRDSLGLLLFRLEAQRKTRDPADTSSARAFESARRELLRMKQQRATTLLISRAAKDRGFEVYTDRLNQLKVTPFPMVAYRILGFGGRMFEVPFVEPQLEWLETEPPTERILP
jgi:peptidyl-prolyl cis-trans isomerase C